MTGYIGLNVLGDYVADRGALVAYVRRLHPGALVVMDNFALYAELMAAAGETCFSIFRVYNPNDAKYHEIMKPEEWLTAHRQFATLYGYVQVLNEPFGYTDLKPLAAWLARLIEITPADMALALPNFAVGHPDMGRVATSELDDLLRALARNPRHILTTHEYAQQSTTDERPYRIGRYRTLLDRARAIGLTPPRVVITEYGRDIGGGEQDGWRGAGMSDEQYAAFLEGGLSVYRADNVPVCIYCYGSGAGGRWQSFNIEGADRLLDRLVRINEAVPMASNTGGTPPLTEPKPANAGAGVAATLTPTQGVNLRVGRTTLAKSIGLMPTGTRLTWYPATAARIGTYEWAWVETSAGGGWMARVAATWAAQFQTVINEPPATPDVLVSVPYYPQFGSGADTYHNDCGEASARMAIGWRLIGAGLPDFAGITVGDLSEDSGKALSATLSIGQVEHLLKLYGFPNAHYTIGGVTLAAIDREIGAGRPVIALVTYAQIDPTNAYKGSHFVLVCGVNNREVIFHDPLKGSGLSRLPRSQFEKALTECGSPAANPSYTGVFVTDAA